MALVTVRRGSSWADLFRSYSIVLDDAKVGRLKRNSSLRIDVAPGMHRLRATVDSGSSNTLPFEASLDGAVEFEVASGAPWWDLDAPIFWAASRNPTGRLRLKLIGTAK